MLELKITNAWKDQTNTENNKTNELPNHDICYYPECKLNTNIILI